MRKKSYKGRCEKQSLDKFTTICKTFDPIPFTLIERRFVNKTLDAVKSMQTARKQVVHSASAENLQAQIDLADHIQVIAGNTTHTDVGLKNIRNTRKTERSRTHIDYTKEVR